MRCVFTMLDAERAQVLAAAATNKMGALLGTNCAWAALLGNAAVESMELTLWKEIDVRRTHLPRLHTYIVAARPPASRCTPARPPSTHRPPSTRHSPPARPPVRLP